MSTVAQLFRQAESLKSSTSDSSFGTNEAWVSRQKLQDLYQRLLVVDLEYSLDKKVEQDLWNHVFKNQINAMQTQAKDRQNAKRAEIQASLNLFLETSSGFYVQLLQELCSAFKLDLPFRRRSSYFGILREPNAVKGMKMPKKSSSMYICQYCLVHLGDIARYRQQIEQAQTYYRHAAFLVPYNGQPYNQLAILEAAKGSKLSTVFYYVRSLAVKHPFPVAATNLEKFYSKITKEVLDIRGKLTMSEIIAAFLQFHAFVHLCTDLDRAQKLMNQLLVSLPSHITSMSFSSHQFIEMIVINLFAMYHAKKHLDKGDKPSQGEERCYNLVLQLTVSLLDNLLHSTPKNNKAREYHTLPAIKLIMDWLKVNQDLLSKPIITNSTIWPCASKLFNHIQHWSQQKVGKFKASDYEQVPLPEDTEVQCFQPVESCYTKLDFTRQLIDNLPTETETHIRCHRLVNHGIWVCDEFPSLNLLNYQKQKNGYHQFSAPTAHVKLLPGDNDKSGGNSDKKSTRQNVAIQAILQHKASQPMPIPKQDSETNKKEGIMKSKHSGDQHGSGKNQIWPKHVQILAPPHSTPAKVSSQTTISHNSPQLQVARNSPQPRNSPQLIGRDSPNVQPPPKQISPQLPVGAKPQPGLVNVPAYSSAQVFGQKMVPSAGHGSNSIDFTGIQVPPPHLQPQANKNIPQHMQPPHGQPQQHQQQRMMNPAVGKEAKPQNDIARNFEAQNQTFNIFSQGFGSLLQEGGSAPGFGGYSENSLQNHADKQLGPDNDNGGWSQFPWPRESSNQQHQMQRHGQKQNFHGNQQQFLSNQNPRQQAQQNQVHFRNNPLGQVNPQPQHPLFIGSPMPVQPGMQQQYPGNQMPYPGNQMSARPIGSRGMVNADQRRDAPGNMNQIDHARFSMAPGTAMAQDQRGRPIDMSAFKMPPPNTIGVSGYPPNAADFARLSEGAPKPDSPLDALPRPMFPSEKQPPNVPGGATYSLFSQSPWSMAKMQPQESKGYGMMQGYSQSQESPPEQGTSGPYTGNNLQSLWSSGPSPLEKLLEQQKQQRQSEPH
ncbi:nonsense-mediated mRNA decay factor SMG7-like [Lineus longissimus]|uniref:nonsense-mediated mRNA decay factor SMG7-like n=1 Tax=Lineus longissimus TaxID=88925 RepID=UPI00315D2B5E